MVLTGGQSDIHLHIDYIFMDEGVGGGVVATSPGEDKKRPGVFLSLSTLICCSRQSKSGGQLAGSTVHFRNKIKK